MERAFRDQYRSWAAEERARPLLWLVDPILPIPDAEPLDEGALRRRATDAGLAFSRGEWFQASAPEVDAAIRGRVAPLSELPASARAFADRARFLFQARHQLARGVALGEILGAIEDGPAEASLRHATLLRIETEVIAAPETLRARRLAEATLALLAERPPGPVQARCLDVLAVLGRREELAVQIFSEAVARAISGARAAAELAALEAPIDDLVTAVLRGTAANEDNEQKAERAQATAQRHAFLAGALAAAHPAWWRDAWQALSREDDDLARAFVGGASATAGANPPAEGLAEAVADVRPQVSLAAWAGVAAGAGAPVLRALVETIPRDPSIEARAEVAGCLRLPDSAIHLLERLLADPDPGVRAAAAFNLAARGAFRDEARRALRADVERGSMALGLSSLRALAHAGMAELDDGLALAHAALEEGGAECAGLSAARALAIWAGPEPAWRALYQRAADDREDLIALGLALDAEFPGLFPSPPELVEPLRIQALQHIGDEQARYAAAVVLAAHPGPEEQLFELFSGGIPESDVGTLAVLSAGARRAHPELVDALWTWIEDETADRPTRVAAMSALGRLAPGSPELLSRLEAELAGPLADAAYVTLARLAAPRATDDSPSDR